MVRDMVKDKKNADSRRKDAEERLEGIEAELRAYQTIEEQEAVLGEAEALLASYNYLQACAQDANILQVNQDSLNRDKWVEKADTTEIKTLLEELNLLGLVKDSYDTFAKNKAELKAMLNANAIDSESLKKEVTLLQELRKIQQDLEHIQVVKEQQDLVFASNSCKLESTKDELDKAVLSGNKCPICDGPLGEKHEHILSNIARFVGSKNNAD
jgi:hypothetical protein